MMSNTRINTTGMVHYVFALQTGKARPQELGGGFENIHLYTGYTVATPDMPLEELADGIRQAYNVPPGTEVHLYEAEPLRCVVCRQGQVTERPIHTQPLALIGPDGVERLDGRYYPPDAQDDGTQDQEGGD